MDYNANTIESGIIVTCDFVSEMEATHVLFNEYTDGHFLHVNPLPRMIRVKSEVPNIRRHIQIATF